VAVASGILAAIAWLAAAPPGPALAEQARAPATAGFTAEYLNDPKNIDEGRAVWVARCQFCHGKAAYPGKAPRLEPSRYTPEFVYDRVANGFGGMPPWRHEFSEQALRAVVAYVLSREFPN
jgi:mono/diheme cytochrome c family protein